MNAQSDVNYCELGETIYHVSYTDDLCVSVIAVLHCIVERICIMNN